MYYSYAMGLDNSIKELEQENFIIEQDKENYKVTFNIFQRKRKNMGTIYFQALKSRLLE